MEQKLLPYLHHFPELQHTQGAIRCCAVAALRHTIVHRVIPAGRPGSISTPPLTPTTTNTPDYAADRAYAATLGIGCSACS